MLEDLYSLNLLRKNSFFALLLGISYSIIGMGGALFLFPDDPALIAVALTAMLMFPLLRKLSEQEEKEVTSFRQLFRINKDAYKIYILLFLGSFLAFAFFAMALPSLAANFLFNNQLSVYFGNITGRALDPGLFLSIFNNNLKVLLFSFIMSLLIGGGAIFIIIWNASLWGTIFGVLAKTAAAKTGQNPLYLFLVIFLIVFVHMILEISSYILASNAGSILSIAAIKKKFLSGMFKTRLQYCVYLLLFAVAVLIIGMIVETYVLDINTYQSIIAAAFS
jgi:uncharacterized membrane protein SpoIIM required for sporulation